MLYRICDQLVILARFRNLNGNLKLAGSGDGIDLWDVSWWRMTLYLNCTFWYGRQHIIAREDFSDCIPSGHRQRVHWTEKCILNRQNHNGNHLTANETLSNIIISFVKCTILYMFWYQYYRTGVLSDMEWLEWLNTTQLRYPDCVCIVESDTCPSPGVTRLYPSWLGTWLAWSPSGHCNMQWDTCYHLVAMAAGRELLNNHIARLHHGEYWYIYT